MDRGQEKEEAAMVERGAVKASCQQEKAATVGRAKSSMVTECVLSVVVAWKKHCPQGLQHEPQQ